MKRSIVAGVALVAGLAGCTSWGTNTVYGPKREVSRQLLGEPAIAESKSASLNAGFHGASNGGVAVAGLGAATDSIKLTHCVQQAEVHYEQPFELQPYVQHRGLDWAGAITLGVIGLIAIDHGYREANYSFGQPGDPYYEGPSDPTASYVTGGLFAAAGAGLLIYSYAKLPHQPAPQVEQKKREWTETTLVEATGCNMGLPGNVAAAPAPAPMPAAAPATPANDVTARLQKLDSLKASGAITDAEYQRKRKEIIDGI